MDLVLKREHAQFYWANDLQSWERAGWNPMFTSQLGIRMADHPDAVRSVSFFLEFETGRRPEGQFYLQQETRWTTGFSFRLS